MMRCEGCGVVFDQTCPYHPWRCRACRETFMQQRWQRIMRHPCEELLSPQAPRPGHDQP